ncbi:translation initiation factor IF-2 N-terminal domain-containing protein [Lactococcus garvieae]|uniref:translation initiation factor IF-2 N-terminal domain-containing protein n=1 Tax=Lactococcus garvieae TaxID=1363 RepID=UPI0030D4B468
MRIYELGRKVDKKSSEILELAQNLGFEVKTASSSVTEEEVEVILKELEPPEKLAPVTRSEPEVSEIILPNDLKEAYEAPRKKKKIFKSNKTEKNKGVKLQKQEYSRPVFPRAHSQKGARIFLACLASITLLVGVGASLAYSHARTSVQEEGKTIIQAGKASFNELSNKSRQINYEAQLFCEDFTRTYLDYSSQPKEQEKQIKTLQAYYGKNLPLASQGMKRNLSRLNELKLLSMTKDTAKFLVQITTQEVKTIPAKGKVKAKQEINENTVQKVFNVSYSEKDGKYYISSFPTLEDTPKVFAGEKAPQVDFTASTELPSGEAEKLDTFVKSVLVAKSTSQKDLNLLAKGLGVSSGEKLVSIDYSYYKRVSKDTYKAVIQASFSNALGVVPENLTFTIEKTGETYFAKDFSNVISQEDLGK